MPLSATHSQQLTGLTDSLTSTDQLLRSPAFVDAISALLDSAQARDQAAADPAAFLRAQGVALPKTARVTFSESIADDTAHTTATVRRITITVCDSIFVLGKLAVSICHTYDSETGFHTTIQVF